MAESTLLAALHRYHARKWQVIPLHIDEIGRSPRPVEKQWQNRGLSAWPDIEATWDGVELLPEVGILTGAPSGIWVLDVDPRHGGHDRLAALQREHGPLPTTHTVGTGNNGWHFYFAMPLNVDIRNTAALRGHVGLDVRGTGGFVTAPPSSNGVGTYRTLVDVPPLPAPGWLLDLARKPIVEALPINGAALHLDMPADPQRGHAYASTALRIEHMRVAAAPEGTRNETAFQAACSMIEIAQSPWANVDVRQVEQSFHAACAACGLPFSEATEVWGKASRRVEGKARAFPALPDVGRWQDHPAPLPFVDATTKTRVGLTLPEEFWAARPALGQIRQAAHSRGRSGDVALHAVLARLASMWPHGSRLDTGVGQPTTANYFSAIVGPSAAGKSSGVGVAKELLPAPAWLDRGTYADSYPLGSGEGIAESFMGWKDVAVPDVNGLPVLDKSGNHKTARIRCQTKHNALFYADEGESLAKLLERVGATVGETIRRAWTGGTLGQSNGRTETTRIIEEGTYAMGLVIGFQRETCQMLLADAHMGTPQRFLWGWAIDASQPTHRVPFPGPLGGVWRPADSTPWLIGEVGAPAGSGEERVPVAYVESIRERLWIESVAVTRGDMARADLDGHEPLALAKVSALLARLDGRALVTEDDWSLAVMVWQTSCRVRDYLIAFGADLAGKAAAAGRAAYADREGAAEGSRLAVRVLAEGAAVERVARRLALRVHEHGVTARRDVMSGIAARDRGYLSEAIMHAVSQGWVIEAGVELSPGGSRPGAS